jgi:hypothetical protein
MISLVFSIVLHDIAAQYCLQDFGQENIFLCGLFIAMIREF